MRVEITELLTAATPPERGKQPSEERFHREALIRMAGEGPGFDPDDEDNPRWIGYGENEGR